MANHQIVDSNTHRDLRVEAGAAAGPADHVMSAMVVPEEFRRAQADYPILFHQDIETKRFSAVALFGFEKGENLYVADDQWTAPRPLSMDIQPFLVGQSPDGEGPGQVHIDMDHPRTGTEDGVRLFDEEGQPTPFLEEMAGKLGALDAGYRASEGYFEALAAHDLLEPFTLEVTMGDGSKNSLVGFHIVNEDKLAALGGDALGALHAQGYLLPTFMALASLSNFQQLVDAKNRKLGLG